MAFLYHDELGSRFSKLVKRDSVDHANGDGAHEPEKEADKNSVEAEDKLQIGQAAAR